MISAEFLASCSDEQIEKGVAWLLVKDKSININSRIYTELLSFYMRIPKDYCTNPNDAWPIIEWIFNQDVTFAMNGGGIMTGNLGSKYGGIKLDIAAKPLRAAMEVYILMSLNK